MTENLHGNVKTNNVSKTRENCATRPTYKGRRLHLKTVVMEFYIYDLATAATIVTARAGEGAACLLFTSDCPQKCTHTTGSTTPDIWKITILSRHCARHYSGSCLKLDVLRIVNSLHNNSYQILPGVSLKFGRAKGGGGGAGGKGQVPLEVVRSIAQENETAEFDKYFYEKIKSQLNSASIHFRLFDDNPATGKTLDTSIWSDLYKTIRGRKKNQGMKNALKNAGMVAGSTLLVMSMKTIMAFSVKAFMAAMLSLLISALQMRKGHGHGAGYTHGSTTYEIIAKPMISHTSSIAVEPHHVEAVSEAQAGGDHYRRSQYFDALDYEPQYGVPRPVPIPVSHYSAAHGHPGSGVVYHAQVNTIN
nr:PREDICTED: uncharacterized protein LOC109030021 [Bemisia tabaci]